MASYNPTADALPGRNVREMRPTIQPRLIQSNIYSTQSYRYHMIAWDVRDPTPGVRDWLEAIRPGDVVGVCPMVRETGSSIISLERIEVDVYCGS